MQDRIYLLDLEELQGEDRDSPLFRRAGSRLDEERLRKVMRTRSSAAGAASLGAGLLIQKAVAERELPAVFFRCFQVRELLEELEGTKAPRQLEYIYGMQGKPYLKGIPIQFSLSHSGRYVLCAVSEGEIGADIQKMELKAAEQTGERGRIQRLSERFFADGEKRLFRGCEDPAEARRLFFELWTKKEALGKMTGEGLLKGSIGEPVRDRQDVEWLDIPAPEGYMAAVCRHKGIS